MLQAEQQKRQQKKRQKEIKWYHIALIGILVLTGFFLWLFRLFILQLFSISWIRWPLFILAIFGTVYVCIFFQQGRKQNVAWKVLLRSRSTYKNLSRATIWLSTLVTAVILILSNTGIMPGPWSNVLTALITEFSLVVALLTLQYTIHPFPAKTQPSIESLPPQADPQPSPLLETTTGIKDSHINRPGLFISYCERQPDKGWAKWCQSVLEAEYAITICPWNLPADAAFLKGMEDRIKETACTIMVLSHTYLKALAAWGTWATAFRYEDQAGRSPGLLLALAEPCAQDKEYTGVLQSMTSLDLFVLDRTTDGKKLLEEVRLIISKAQAPTS